jgi:hypothetical protein
VPTAYTLLARKGHGERDRAYERADQALARPQPIAGE